jgi:hypothetical protein
MQNYTLSQHLKRHRKRNKDLIKTHVVMNLPGTTGFRLTNAYEWSVTKNTSLGSILNFPK